MSDNIDWATIRQNAGAVRIDNNVNIPVGNYQALCEIDNVKKNDVIIGRILLKNGSSTGASLDVALSINTSTSGIFEYQAVDIGTGNSLQAVLSALAPASTNGKVYLMARIPSSATGKTVSAKYYGLIKIKNSE